MVCIADLTKALDHFNQAAHFVADRIVAKLGENSASELKYNIELSIQAYLDDLDFEVEAHSSFHYDSEPLRAVLQHWEIAEGPLVLYSNNEQITFSLELDCIINFEAEFELSVYDGIDKDWVKLGSTTAKVEETSQLSLTITCTRDFDPEPEVIDVEVTKRRLYVDFGYVDPNWGYEE